MGPNGRRTKANELGRDDCVHAIAGEAIRSGVAGCVNVAMALACSRRLLRAVVCWMAVAQTGWARTNSCRPSRPTATRRASRATAHRHLDHRARLLPVQEEDGRGLGHASTVQLGEPAWPKGEDHTDEYFGTQEIYRGKVEVPVPFTIPGRAAREARARAASCRAARMRACAIRRRSGRPKSHCRASARRQRIAALARSSHRAGNERRVPAARRAFRFGAGMLAARFGRADLDHRRRLLPL